MSPENSFHKNGAEHRPAVFCNTSLVYT